VYLTRAATPRSTSACPPAPRATAAARSSRDARRARWSPAPPRRWPTPSAPPASSACCQTRTRQSACRRWRPRRCRSCRRRCPRQGCASQASTWTKLAKAARSASPVHSPAHPTRAPAGGVSRVPIVTQMPPLGASCVPVGASARPGARRKLRAMAPVRVGTFAHPGPKTRAAAGPATQGVLGKGPRVLRAAASAMRGGTRKRLRRTALRARWAASRDTGGRPNAICALQASTHRSLRKRLRTARCAPRGAPPSASLGKAHAWGSSPRPPQPPRPRHHPRQRRHRGSAGRGNSSGALVRAVSNARQGISAMPHVRLSAPSAHLASSVPAGRRPVRTALVVGMAPSRVNHRQRAVVPASTAISACREAPRALATVCAVLGDTARALPLVLKAAAGHAQQDAIPAAAQSIASRARKGDSRLAQGWHVACSARRASMFRTR
jgi:hypothetical protein